MPERPSLFTPEQYHAKATEYSNLVGMAKSPNEASEYRRLERSFTELADNAQWVARCCQYTQIHAERTAASSSPVPALGGM